jgi:hypothetical protein
MVQYSDNNKEKEELKQELEAFRKNKLIEKKLLISKQGNDKED